MGQVRGARRAAPRHPRRVRRPDCPHPVEGGPRVPEEAQHHSVNIWNANYNLIILCFLTLWAFLFWTPSSSSCHNFGRLFVVNINLKSTSISSTLIEFDFTLS